MRLRIFSLSLLLLAAPAAASDGRIEINQACAIAGGCAPGDAPGFPVSIPGQQSYVLTSSLEVTGGASAITSNQRDVTLDLNGFTIFGTYSCNVNPPNCIARGNPAIDLSGNGATVRNGRIRTWGGTAVNLGVDSRAEALGVNFGGNDGIVAGSGSAVVDSRISGLVGDGIRLTFNSEIAGVGSVEGNIIQSVRGDAIELSQGVVLRNYTSNAFMSHGRFGPGVAYGLNRFGSAPLGGTSLGNSVCGSSVC